jgi:hypothetical protein
MLEAYDCVPFTVEAFGGFAEAHGLMRLEGNALVLEFQLQDSILNVLRSDVREVRIPLEEIEAITFKRGWLRAKFTIKTYKVRTLKEVPGSDKGEVTLHIRHKDRQKAARLASDLELKLLEHQIDRLESQSDRGL